MIFLESPDLGDPTETWVEWLAYLRTKNQRDISVKFAVQRAERIIEEMENFAAEQGHAAFA